MSRPPSDERASTTGYMPPSPVSPHNTSSISRRYYWSLPPDGHGSGLGLGTQAGVGISPLPDSSTALPTRSSPSLSPSFPDSPLPMARSSPRPDPLNLTPLGLGMSASPGSSRASFAHHAQGMGSTASLDSPGFDPDEEGDTVLLTASLADGDSSFPSFAAEAGSTRSTPRRSPGQRLRDRHSRRTSVTGQAMKAMGRACGA